MAWGREGLTASSDPVPPRVDQSVVVQLITDLGPASVVEVCGVFGTDGRERLRAIRAACATGDAGAVAGSAHRLKSASGFLGVSGVAVLCAEIEAMARGGRLGEVPGRVDVATEELEAALRDLGALVRTAGRPEAGAGGPLT